LSGLSRWRLGWLAAAAVAALTTSCFEQTGPMPRQGGILYIALNADPDSLNPLVAGDDNSARAYAPLYPLLYQVHGDFTVSPLLAADLPAVADAGATLTVPLRPDAKWSDGMPITADDVVYTVTTETNPHLDTHTGFDWSPLKSVTKVDDHTVRFALSRPDASFLANRLVTPIVPQHVFAAVDPSQMSTAPFSSKPAVSGGPFTLDHRVAGQMLVLNANPTYFGGHPHPDQVIFVVVTDQATLPAQLAEGKVLWAPNMAPDVAGQAVITSGVTVRSYPATGFVAVQFNVRAGHVFTGAAVRQAFAASVDHDSTVLQATGADQAFAVWSNLYPNSWAYSDNAVVKYSIDVNHAQQLLHGDGWTSGAGGIGTKAGQPLAAPLIYPKDDAARTSAAMLLASQTHNAGFALTPTGLSSGDFTAAVNSGNFEAALVSVPTGLDPDGSALLHSGAPLNTGGYANPSVDSLLDKEVTATAAGGATVMQVRAALFMQLEKAVTRDLPFYFMWAPRVYTAFGATLGGVAGAAPNLDHDRNISIYNDWYLTG
jgi:peptide/nickel transport system substrate-binding protein